MTTSPTWHFAPRHPRAARRGRGGDGGDAKCGEDLDTQKHQDDWMVLMASVNCPVAT